MATEQPRRLYRVRDGYVWHGPKGLMKGPGENVSLTDEEYQKTRHQLEPVSVARPAATGVENDRAAGAPPADRQMKGRRNG